ncbi:MAG: MarR family winged helix-turn-helix transcriptional regulator [Clostridia bacterium]|nr:MarR family winged helix-turn-helix transcriptional regulator [Clostridia bacterium]
MLVDRRFWDDALLFKLIYDQALDPVSRKVGLNRMELNLLLFLANNPEYDTASDAIRLRQWTKSHVSAAVRSLTERGFICAQFRSGNRKTVHLSPTPVAEEAIRLGQAAQESFSKSVLMDFTEEDRRELERLFTKIAFNIRKSIRTR